MSKARIALISLFAVAALSFAATPALAKEVHVYSASFGGAGSGAGQFKEPQGVAVNDTTGDVYVVDKGNNRVEWFNSTGGKFEGQFDGSGSFEVGGKKETGAAAPTGAFSKPEWIAVDNDPVSESHGDVYVTDSGHKVIDKFGPTGEYLGQIATGEGGAAFSELDGVAVNLMGEVWVYQSSNQVDNYSNALANGFLESRALSLSGETPAPGFAVGPEDDLYANVYEAANIYHAEADEFFDRQTSTGGFVGFPAGTGKKQIGAGVDLSNDELYIDFGGTVGAFDASTETQVEAFGSGDLTGSTGIGVNSATNGVYVADGGADRVDAFPATTVADTTTEAPTGVAETSAVLHGTVDPEGLQVSKCEFEYGTEPGVYTQTQPCSTAPGSGTAPVPVEAQLGGLLANTAYYYRVAATDADGTDYGSEAYFNGPEASFTTPSVPRISNVSAEVNQTKTTAPTSATLKAEVDPDERETTYHFEYGETTSYEHSTPEETLPAGAQPVPVTAALSGLKNGTPYHYRLVASNEYDEHDPAESGDRSFTTLPPTLVEGESVSGVTADTAAVSGEVDPEGFLVDECRFEYGTSTQYGDGSVPCEAPDAAEIGTGTAPVTVHAALTGLRGGTTYHFRLVVTNEIASTKEVLLTGGEDLAFKTSTVAVIAGGEASEVTGSGAELGATVNPEGLQVSRCTFEYGTSTAYGSSVRCAQKKSEIGAGTQPVPVSAQLTELEPNTTYHWRLNVKDANGEALGSDHTFVYPTTEGTELPDHRAYEMVTPPQKNGALIGDVFFGFFPAFSEDGSRVIALNIQCFAPAVSCTGNRGVNGEPYEFTRTSTGWQPEEIAPSATEFSENTPWLFNADVGTALFSMPTGPAKEDEWYARSSTGSFSAIGPTTPPGVTGVGEFDQHIRWATADLSHVIWEGGKAVWPFDMTRGENSLYEYFGTGNEEPFLVGVSGGYYNANSSERNNELISDCGTLMGGTDRDDYTNPMSADGRIVYFTPQSSQPETSQYCFGSGVNEHTEVPVSELYARVDGEESTAHTVAISQPDAPETRASTPPDESCASAACQKDIGEPANWRNAEFRGATADGTKVFFSSEQRLTDNAGQDEGENLYESACVAGCEGSATTERRSLTDLSEDEGAPVAGGPRVQGVMGVSADGSHVYFVAQGRLTKGARQGNGGQCVKELAASEQAQEAAAQAQEERVERVTAGGKCRPQEGGDNLYAFDTETRHTAFVATLTPFDGTLNWAERFRANVTPDGRFIVFQSQGELTPDTDTGGSSGTQVFRYDAVTGQLVRISIGNDGFDDDGNGGTGKATIAWAVFPNNVTGPPRGDPTMSNDGSYVFFQSPRGLTPHALDDVVIGHENGLAIYAQNVYEYREGHVYLISDGHDAGSAETYCKGRILQSEEKTEGSGSAVCLLGTDATGHNVFFTTADRLVPKDTDTQVDIYDARVCEPENGNPCIAEPAAPLPPCDGENCHGIPAATPSLLAPGSATFNGEGNIASPPPAVVKPKSLTRAQKLANALKVCKRDKKKSKRVACEKQAKKKYGVAKKSSKKKGK